MPPLHLLGVGLSPTRIACTSSSSVRCWVKSNPDCLGVGLSPALIAGALVFGMYILFHSVLCTGATVDEALLPGATDDVTTTTTTCHICVCAWMVARKSHFLVVHLHVHLLSSSPPLPPLHLLGVGLSPTHHHHSDKYNECRLFVLLGGLLSSFNFPTTSARSIVCLFSLYQPC